MSAAELSTTGQVQGALVCVGSPTTQTYANLRPYACVSSHRGVGINARTPNLPREPTHATAEAPGSRGAWETAAALLADVRSAGLSLVLEPPADLRLRGGTQEARAALLPRLRAHKPALLEALTEPRRLWLVRHADGTIVSHSFTPPATLAEVLAWYPGCDAEPEEEPEAPPGPMPPDADLARVRGWLARTGEQDRTEIARVLDACRNPEALQAFLRLAGGES